MTGLPHLYNEIEPFAAAWLENLMMLGEIPLGRIDERPIQELRGRDVVGLRQFHAFAGVGGWPLALKLAGWPEDRPVWTGSCPCQPFSVAGRGRGVEDERHVWPDFLRLISEGGGLQSSLESRLRQRLAVYGSPEYALTWKHWDIPSGPPICALRASVRRTSARDFTGWPTATKTDSERRGVLDREAKNKTLNHAAQLMGYATPKAGDYRGARAPEAMARRKAAGDGNANLNDQMALAGWPTTTSLDRPRSPETLEKCAAYRKENAGQNTVPLYLGEVAAIMAGYPTPNAWDSQGSHGGGQGASLRTTAQFMGHGTKQNSASAPTEKRGALNPDLARWLMGFPAVWAFCGAGVTLSSRKSRLNL